MDPRSRKPGGAGSRPHGGARGGAGKPGAKKASRPKLQAVKSPAPKRLTRKEIWRNRMIALAILIALVGLVIWGIIWGIGKGTEWFEKQGKEAAEQRAALAESNKTWPAVPRCENSQIQVQAAPAAASIITGNPQKIDLVVKNVSKDTCFTDGNDKTVGVRVISGNEIVWDSVTCAEDFQRQLLLKPGQTWKNTIDWNGHRYGSQCGQSGDAAAPGTYRAVALWQGNTSGEERVFVVEAPPPPPAPEPAAQPEAQPQPAG